MKRIRAVAAAAAIAAGLSVASAGTVEAPDALIVDAMDAPAHVTYAGTVEVVRIGQSGSEASVLRIEHRAPARTRTNYAAPADLSGDEIVALGDRSYAIDSKRKRVVRSENPALDDPTVLAANYILLRQNYQALARPDETRAGRAANDVALVNDYTHRTVAVVSIDRTTKLVLDKQEFAPDGTLVSEMRFLSVSYPNALPDADFAVPDGFNVVDGPNRGLPSQGVAGLLARSGFPARCPMQIQHGFTAVEGKLVTMQGVRTLHVLFSDGLRTVSLFETAGTSAVDLARYHPQSTTVATQSAQYAEDGATTILVWSDGTRRYTLVAQMTLEELQRMAASIAG